MHETFSKFNPKKVVQVAAKDSHIQAHFHHTCQVKNVDQ